MPVRFESKVHSTKRRAVLALSVVILVAIVVPQGVTRIARRNEKVRPGLLRGWNAMTTQIAGRRFSPVSLIEHTGRRSGRSFCTPVTSARFEDGFLLPLPYGPGVDWCRNVQAAGYALLRRGGHRYRLAHPQVVPIDAAVLEQLPAHLRFTIKNDATQGLLLRHDTDGDARKVMKNEL
ncbi:deazaflavin-dependent nitroreductase family protein [Mycobacteroides abscessus subsp. abscessus]|uniref:nitroreductase family deazaflavin-dependent oxidoreductase n=1 Tax=Mycobacteroides abscessus TaxID=36809 RepID=UPI000929FEB6|nr:nitroreductase family deazaflavin-dependent oxidoreductase [Mycobacteroides abscessus]MDM2349433.1 nitroreductase family deazaflavin-dependent oxidoreductase [Mycobacteroides abscessus]MDM2357741.1 nitroreductase family deazaflavin-dependent oxidoreductase [Mycobacteroides abscessus]SID40126.1 deazaflavin-dependent nitroreductase family protein [Mycobacteroides abscessus subsp. abscessus]SKU69594.1 deazaflavin-dependent nitroreductase family protein [Mycobacteroides abscessus subsp. abscessu